MRRFSLFFSGLILSVGCDDETIVGSVEVSVEPAEISFGRVPTGQARTVAIRIENRSPTRPLRIDRVRLLEGSSPAFSVSAPTGEVAPGQTVEGTVRYAADDGEPDTGHVVVESNAVTPEVRIPLGSDRTFPKLSLRPNELDLGQVKQGEGRSVEIQLGNVGEAPLDFARLSLRTEGFAGEVCQRDADCREGRCTPSSTGAICALPCDGGCPAGYACTTGVDGLRACREEGATRPPLAARGFSLGAGPTRLLPEETGALSVRYEPGPSDRGHVQVIVESNAPERPFAIVWAYGRPDNLPPVAVTELVARPAVVSPGAVIGLSGLGSYDPEGTALEYKWRFLRRPEGSRSAFAAVRGSTTTFAVDLPGTYVAALEVRDASGLASTNDARIEVEAAAGRDVSIVLTWDRPDTDLDLHLVSPGAPLGSVGDCHQDNPNPDWTPAGMGGDPSFTAEVGREAIAIQDPADGVYTIVVAVAVPSPQGSTRAQVKVYLDGVEAAVAEATLTTDLTQWDVATLSRPSGRYAPLGTLK